MEHRRLGRLEQENSVLTFGGAALSETGEEDSDRAIQQALDAGVNHFDTAADYGDSELEYGRWSTRPAGTKTWWSTGASIDVTSRKSWCAPGP